MGLSQQQALLYEAILKAAPGKTVASKLAYLKGQGFDLTAGPQAEYAGATAPVLTNPVGEMYASDKGFSSIFDLINKGVDPITAVNKARADKLIPAVHQPTDPLTGDVINYTQIAQDYAKANFDNKAKLDAFNQSEAQKKAQWEQKQKPNLMNELGSNTVYQDLATGFGKDFTAQDLVNQYAQSHMFGQQQQQGFHSPVGTLTQQYPGHQIGQQMAAPTGSANPYGSDLLKMYMTQQAQQQLNPLISKAKATSQYDPRISQLIDTITATRASGV